MRSLQPRERRTIAIASAGIAIYLAVFFGGMALRALRERSDEYESLVARRGMVEARASVDEERAAAIRSSLGRLGLTRSDLARVVSRGDVLARIQTLAEETGLALGNQTERETTATGVVAMFEIQLTGGIRETTKFLHRIGRTGLLLRVDRIDVRSAGEEGARVTTSIALSLLDGPETAGTEASRA